MYILSDGKNYVIRNPLQPEKLMKSTSSNQAIEFSYKQARNLLRSKKASTKWIKNEGFQMINTENNTVVKSNRKSNAGIYIDSNDISLDESLIESIFEETNLILSLKNWNKNQLITYKNLFLANLSKYDSAESDILHAIEKYKVDTGKNPQAHKMTKIYVLLEEIRSERRKVKQCLRYIDTMLNAVVNKYSLEQLKVELSKSIYREYKGRTELKH